jgi:hypothetical protein
MQEGDYARATREQDRVLADVEKGLDHLNVVGMEIRDKLDDDAVLLAELDGVTGGVTERTRSAQKSANGIVRRATGTVSQIVVVIGLVAVAATLAYFVFR